MKRRGISILLAVTLFMSFFSMVYAENTVTIGTAEELKGIIASVKTDGGTGKTYRLTADIDLGGILWDGIGSTSVPFNGNFLGDGHVVSNFKISATQDGTGYGLFGTVGGDAVITRLGVKNVDIKLDNKDTWETCAGGLAGLAAGNAKITECFAKDVAFALSWEDAAAHGQFGDGGGLVGKTQDDVLVKDCYSVGYVYAKTDRDGGLVGGAYDRAAVENCYSDTTLVRCMTNESAAAVKNSYYLAEPGWPGTGTTANTYPGTKITADALRNYHTILGNAFVKGSASNGGYPAFSWEPVAEGIKGDGTESNPYFIASYDNLVEVATMEDTDGKFFKMTTDIDLENKIWTNYIGSFEKPFKGVFDGDGHTIKNYKIFIQSPGVGTGIFGVTDGDAMIKNVGVENISVDGNANWNLYASSFVGVACGNTLVTNCYAKKLENLYQSSSMEINALGGIIGYAKGDGVTVRNCYAYRMNIGTSTADYDAGIVGRGEKFKLIENCYSTYGIIRANKNMAEKVVNCYDIGSLGWPFGDDGSSETYHGNHISMIQLRALASTLGSAFKKGGAETGGFPALSWETITEINTFTNSVEVDSDKIDFIYETRFDFTDNDEIVIGFHHNSSVEEVQLLSLNDSEITIARKFNTGNIQKGTYRIKVDFNFSCKIIVITVIMPDGSVYKRGDSALMCGFDRADVVSVSSTKEDAIKSAKIIKYEDKAAKKIVFEEKPQADGFDALVYNFISSYDVDGKTTRNFAWSADLSFDKMEVMYKAEDENDWLTQTAIREEAQDEVYQNIYYYKADLTGLKPGTTYVYRYGKTGSVSETDWSKEYTFKTEEEDCSDFRFVAISDTQGLSWDGEFKYTKEVMDEIKEMNPAFVMHGGDVVESGGYESYWQDFFKSIDGVSHNIPFFIATGNHDTWSDEQWSSLPMGKDVLFDLHLNHPNNGGNAELGDITPNDLNPANKSGRRIVENMDETFYSYNYGGAHFIVLNSGSGLEGSYGYSDDDKLLAAQKEWLVRDLEANKDAKWTVLMLHQPVYAQYHDYESKTVIKDVIDKYKIDLVITGHDHSVSRTHAVRGDTIVDKSETMHVRKGDGTVYAILGPVTPLHRVHITDGDQYHEANMLSIGSDDTIPVYTVVDISDDKLEVTSKMLNGYVIDNYKIVADETQLTGVTVDGEKIFGIDDLLGEESANLNFYYRGGEAKELVVIVGYYDDTGRLVSMSKLNGTDTEPGRDLYSFRFTPAELTGVNEIKFFVWDSVKNPMPVVSKVYSLR